jgi:hypothetical protein
MISTHPSITGCIIHPYSLYGCMIHPVTELTLLGEADDEDVGRTTDRKAATILSALSTNQSVLSLCFTEELAGTGEYYPGEWSRWLLGSFRDGCKDALSIGPKDGPKDGVKESSLSSKQSNRDDRLTCAKILAIVLEENTTLMSLQLEQQNKFSAEEGAALFDAIRKNPRSALIDISLGICSDKEEKMGIIPKIRIAEADKS